MALKISAPALIQSRHHQLQSTDLISVFPAYQALACLWLCSHCCLYIEFFSPAQVSGRQYFHFLKNVFSPSPFQFSHGTRPELLHQNPQKFCSSEDCLMFVFSSGLELPEAGAPVLSSWMRLPLQPLGLAHYWVPSRQLRT